MAKQDIFSDQIKQGLRKDIIKMFRASMSAYCKKAADELTKTAEYAMQDFYNDYKPKWYDRTYDLKNKSYSRYYRNHGNRFSGGVSIGSEEMKTHYKNANELEERDPYLIASTAWESGLHGIYGWHTEEGSNGIIPMQIIDEKMKDKKFLNELEDNANDAIYKQTYKYLGIFL